MIVFAYRRVVTHCCCFHSWLLVMRGTIRGGEQVRLVTGFCEDALMRADWLTDADSWIKEQVTQRCRTVKHSASPLWQVTLRETFQGDVWYVKLGDEG